MARTLSNPDTLEGRLYRPGGEMQLVPYVPSRDDNRYMDAALAQAAIGLREGNSPVGAALVTPKSTYLAHSTEVVDRDLRKHAELNAYDKAQPEVGLDLSESLLYVTLEPCGMCLAPMLQGRLSTLMFGAAYADVPDFLRQKEYDFDKMLRSAGRNILVIAGLKREKAMNLMAPENKRHKSAHEH